MIAIERVDIRCRFCGLMVGEEDVCGWNDDGHVYVHPDNPGWKRHPFTQYAATLYELARMCEKCGALIREGEGTDGKVRWYTEADSREHWRECQGGT